MEYRIGDHVRTRQPGTQQAFIINEIETIGGKTCYTGEGRLWWDAENLELDLNEQQLAVLIRYERAAHEYRQAESNIDTIQIEADDVLPQWVLDRVEA